MMTQRTALVAIAVFLVMTILWIACAGGGSGEPRSPQAGETGTPEPGTPDGSDPWGDSPRTVDLAAIAPLTVVYAKGEGDLQSDQPGLATGDFNDDGIDDILVGARFADVAAGREDAGTAYVVLGSREPPDSFDLAADEQQTTVLGARPGDGLGFSAATADLNGDGADDIVVGAPFAGPLDQPESKPGRVYIIFGRTDLPTSVDLTADRTDVTLTGMSADGFFGDSLATGDINGDGTADLIVGATFDSHSTSPASSVRGGAVYVFFGRERWPEAVTPEDSDIAVYGADDYDELGDFVASGDINGDGIVDIAATAEAADGPGNARDTAAEVYVIYGGPDVKGAFDVAQGQVDLKIFGAHNRDTLGFSLASGDLNGDGIDELIMGARLASAADGSDDRAGRVYVLYGRHDLPAEIDMADPPEFVATIYGQSQADFLGSSEAVADLGGSGRTQLIMGAGFADTPSRADSGAIYIVVEGTAAGDVAGVAGDAVSRVIFGAAPGDRLGANVAAADFNGDGRLELVVVAEGAAGPDESRPAAGRVYVIAP